MNRAQRLRAAWAEINRHHFNGSLKPVPIRITRSRRTYGYYNGPNNGGQPSIRISTVMADTWGLVYDTLKHEMIHQWLHERGFYADWDQHGPAFQSEHARIFGHDYVEAS